MLPLERPVSTAPPSIWCWACSAITVGWPICVRVVAHSAWPKPWSRTSFLAAFPLERQTRFCGGFDSLAEILRHRAALLDLAPRQILRLDGAVLPGPLPEAVCMTIRYGPGIFKVHLGPRLPASSVDDRCVPYRGHASPWRRGTLGEVAAAPSAAYGSASLPSDHS